MVCEMRIHLLVHVSLFSGFCQKPIFLALGKYDFHFSKPLLLLHSLDSVLVEFNQQL